MPSSQVLSALSIHPPSTNLDVNDSILSSREWFPGRPGVRAGGSALVVVLWAMVLLGVGVFSVLRSTRLELKVAHNLGDRVQARFLALAGIEKAKALIHAAREEEKGGGSSSTLAMRMDNPRAFREVRLGRGLFDVFRSPAPGELAGDRIYAVVDEESRLNVNLASGQELLNLPDMPPGVVAAIADWRDQDGRLTPMGAEADYYAGLSPPYRIRNGPFETMRELLLVKDVTVESLLGEDTNANGRLDPNEDDGSRSAPVDNQNGRLEAGWSRYLTLESSVRNLNARGRPRVDIRSASAEDLAEVEGLGTDLAQAIADSRNVRQLGNLVDLLQVRHVEKVERPAGTSNSTPTEDGFGRNPPPNTPASGNPPPGGEPNRANRTGSNPSPSSGEYREVGDPLISQELLIEIADGLTARDEVLAGVVNINTADEIVLACLPGMTQDLARALVDHRDREGQFSNIAEVLNVTGFTTQIFKQLSPRISVRSDTFRIVAEGRVPSSGARKVVEAVVRLTDRDVTTLYFREDS